MFILKDNIPRPLLTHCNPTQIEQKYGGTAPNLTVYWPPHVPPGPYGPNDAALEIQPKVKRVKRRSEEVTNNQVVIDIEELAKQSEVKEIKKTDIEFQENEFFEIENEENFELVAEINEFERVSKKKGKAYQEAEIEATENEEIVVDQQYIIFKKRSTLNNIQLEEFNDTYEFVRTKEASIVMENHSNDATCGFLKVPSCKTNEQDACTIL